MIKGGEHEPYQTVFQIRQPEHLRPAGYVLLHPGRYLFHLAGGRHQRCGSAEPLSAHLQLHLRHRLHAGPWCGHPLRHPPGAGRRAVGALFLQRPALGAGVRPALHAGGSLLPRGAAAVHGRRRGDRCTGRGVRPHLPAVHALLHVQLHRLGFCPQRQRPLTGHGGDHLRKPLQRGVRLHLHVPHGPRPARRGAGDGSLAGVEHCALQPPLLQKEQHRPPCAAAALAEATGPELPAGRLGLRGRDVLRRDHHRLQPAAPASGGQCGRGGLRRRGELRAGGDRYLQRRGPGSTAAGQQVLRQKRCRRCPQAPAAGQRNSACAGGGTVCGSVRVHRADRRGLQQ